MKIYNVSEAAINNEGEFVLGSAELKTQACYLVYGFLTEGEKGRELKPGKGHEEIICIARGEVILRRGDEETRVRQGEAFYMKGEETYLMYNRAVGETLYVIAGGHTEEHHHV
ncbi:MAG: hypothetical protein HZA17_11370 [Nitrospirae bacterium]|nr:hypothetical protein [Nitrospirota bacterium]